MIKNIKDLNNIQLEQFKLLYTKYFVEEAKRTDLGFSLLFELVTKKNSKTIVESIVKQFDEGNYLGYVYIEDNKVLGFIVGLDEGVDPAKITETYMAYKPEHKNYLFKNIIFQNLYHRLLLDFKERGRTKVFIEASTYNRSLTSIAISNAYTKIQEYPDSYVEYEKHI